MKLYKKILLTAGVVFLVLGTASGIFIASMTCFRDYNGQENKALTTWMKSIKDEIKINEIVIPGSHDAGTYSMSWLGATQHLTMNEQLQLGVRYFDLRVNKKGDNYVMFHSIIDGVNFDPLFDDIVDFINSNPSETLLLDFQHFKNGSQTYVFETVTNKLKDKLVINETNLSDLEFIDNLKLVDARGKCIVFFGDNSKYDEYNYIFKRNNDEGSLKGCALDSYYEKERHVESSSSFIDESLPYYFEKISHKKEIEKYKGIFVLQGQLTDGALVFGPYHRERNHEDGMTEYLNNIHKHEYFEDTNVIMRDFLDESKINNIVDLNKIKDNFKH